MASKVKLVTNPYDYLLAINIGETRETNMCLTPQGEQEIELNSLQLIEDLCVRNGSTLKGRIQGSQKLLSRKQLPPICVSAYHNLYYIPLDKPSNKDCLWLNYESIVDIKKAKKFSCIVIFKQGYELEIPYTRNQVSSAYNLCTTLRNLIIKPQ